LKCFDLDLAFWAASNDKVDKDPCEAPIVQ
jgi:hypothetical protein